MDIPKDTIRLDELFHCIQDLMYEFKGLLMNKPSFNSIYGDYSAIFGEIKGTLEAKAWEAKGLIMEAHKDPLGK